MRFVILAFAAGIVALQFSAELPAASPLGLLLTAGVVLIAAGMRCWHWLLLPGAALLGFAWAGGLAQHRLADALPTAVEGRDVDIVGVVASLPQRFDNGLRFDFDVENATSTVPSRISLAWYSGWRTQEDDDFHALPEIRAGERWSLTVRLKRPHGNLNPDGFDFEAWLFEQNVRATGYVRKAETNRKLADLVRTPGYVIERLRQHLRDHFQRALGDAPYAGVLVALAIGDQRAIDQELWQVFARTGVTHLLSVSGLHVTMVAGLAAWLAGWGWRRSSRLMLRLPAQKVAAAAGFLSALAYCLLAGFAVPAQRTLYMLAVVALALWTGRTTVVSRVLALALLLVLLLDPWAVLAAGFWLSFGAVGLLFYIGTGRLGEGHWLAAWGRAQWAVTVGMIPALLAMFQQFSLVSPLANAVAIPVISLLVTPLALLGALPFAEPLLWLAHWLTAELMLLLDWLAASDWAVWQQQAPPGWAVALGVAGVGWLLMPRGFPAHWIGIVALLPLVFVPVPRPAVGEAIVRVLDVGQGLAVHVQTAGHDLLYDAGPAFSADANSGNRIIVPYLRAAGVRALDTMMVSHQDKDHEGGAESVLESIPTALLLTSVSAGHPLSALPVAHRQCVDGEAWEWDGVRFHVLHPTEGDYSVATKSNDLSCVLKVSAISGAVLLTGDIEARNEAALLARHGADVAAEVLVPPHHGSRSSSTPAFIAGVQPRLTIYSAGYRNRFGHPATEVVKRFEAAGTEPHRTDADGAVTVLLGRHGVVTTAERQTRHRYWHAR
ncbi:MAG TPA: DNA internalization-related competence protein ComEC/Rec2 [Rhodocyclaceae bacterium]|nr:DNA internalization-related competence protein ComEC/Rec2 [Rhodocyclaceae bacterium]